MPPETQSDRPTEPTPEPLPVAEQRRPTAGPGLEPELLAEELAHRHDPYAALRDPDYRLFAAGFTCSSMALQMVSTAVLWEVYARTNDVFSLGLVGLARVLPVMLLALPAGHAIDLYNRKRLLVGTQAAFAVLTALLALASWSRAGLPVFFTIIGLTACIRTFNSPTRQSLLPLIVPPGHFHNAITWNSGVFQFSALAGPILAGVVMARTGHAWPVYAASAAGMLIFSVSASFIRFAPPPRSPTPFTLRSMLAGLGHLWNEKTILATIALDLFAVLFGGATALLPVYAKDILGVGADGYGVLRAAPYFGALLMALVLAHRPPFRRAGRALLWSVAGYGAAMIVFGVSHWFWLSIGALLLAGAFDNISVVIRHVLVQVRTPDHLRGRVAAVNSVFIESSNELGAFESGAVAAIFGGGARGSMISVVSGGIGTILVVIGVARKWPQIRRLGRLDPPAP
ncbi:MAG: MFS transporter [Phycisphaerales bacterium]